MPEEARPASLPVRRRTTLRVPGGEPAGDSAGDSGSDTDAMGADGDGERDARCGDALEHMDARLAEWRLARRISSLIANIERLTHMSIVRARIISVRSNAVSKCGIHCGCGTLS